MRRTAPVAARRLLLYTRGGRACGDASQRGAARRAAANTYIYGTAGTVLLLLYHRQLLDLVSISPDLSLVRRLIFIPCLSPVGFPQGSRLYCSCTVPAYLDLVELYMYWIYM
jgi:hypothetical protein